MNQLAPPVAAARRSLATAELEPPGPTQSAVPGEFASLNWSGGPAGGSTPGSTTWVPQSGSFAPPLPAPAPPTHLPAPSAWTWTPVMNDADRSLDAPLLDEVSSTIDLAGRLDRFITAEHAPTAPLAPPAASTTVALAPPAPPMPETAPFDAPTAMPDVSFEAADGTLSTEVLPAAQAVVTAEVPVFESYAPSADFYLPEAPPMEPHAYEVREVVVSLPPERTVRPKRSGRSYLVGLILVAVAAGGAYVGLREYIYDASADDGTPTRVVTVEPAEPIVVDVP